MKRTILLFTFLFSLPACPQARMGNEFGMAVYRACLAEYYSLPWWRRMWYRHEGNCSRYIANPDI